MTHPCVLVLDTETTGLPEHDFACVVELGAVIVAPSGAIVSRWTSLVRPNVPPPPEADDAMRVNGLNRAELDLAPPWSEVRSGLLRWVFGCDYVGSFSLEAVTSYNVDFDQTMINRAGGMGVLDRMWGDCIQLDAGAKLNDPEAHRRRDPRRPPLWWSARELGVKQSEPAHRALSDAETAARVMVALRGREAKSTRRPLPPTHV